jgi:hypothetical protein
MVVAFGADGSVAMAVDSVAWQPSGGGTVGAASAGAVSGRWVTSPSERERRGRVRAASVDGKEPTADTSVERPSVLVLASSPGQPVVAAQGATVGPRIPMCAGPHEAKDMGVHPVRVGEIHLNKDWTSLRVQLDPDE